MLPLLLLQLALAAPPAVTKVEPPDWPAEPRATTLRVLVTGSNLTDIAVSAPFKTANVKATGTHAFFDLQLPANAPPGPYPIRIQSSSGRVDAPFAIVPTLAPQGRFQGFSPDDVIYLLMPDRFANGDRTNDDPAISKGLYDPSKPRYYHGGDFAGIIQRLPYLKSLGITAVWMTPIYDNSNTLNTREKYNNRPITDYHGYGAVDFYNVDEHFGTLDQFRQLVDAAHALGIKVIQDEVANHTGPFHPWVKDPPTPTWYNGSEAQHLNETWRTWTLIDPHAPPALQRSTLDGWFANILPDLNQNDPECARYLIQNTLWWIGRTGVDGIREDTLPYVPRSFWKQWTSAIAEHYPRVNVVGEVFDGDPALVASFQAGTGVDALFDFPLHYAIRKFFTGKAPASEIAKVLAHDSLYRNPDHLVTFVDLHDIKRFMTEPGASVASLKNVFTLLLTMRGIPMIYYGDELAMQGGDDPDNRRDFPSGAFEPQGRTAEQNELIAHLQHLTKLRAELEPLRRGDLKQLFVEADQYAYSRTFGHQTVLVAFNRAQQPKQVDIEIDLPEGTRLQSDHAATVHNGRISLVLDPNSSAIYLTTAR
jgi:glycosidase